MHNHTLIKRIDLEIEYEYDFLLFGLVSAEMHYRLAWHFNRLNPYNFERIDDYAITLNAKPAAFPMFCFWHEENHTTYFLLANKNEGFLLLPELKNFDYLLLVKGALDFFDETMLRADINKIAAVQLIYQVDVAELKSKKNLIYI